MGTLLYERLGFRYVCFEELNVTEPQLVQRVHRDYLGAGAELIETNTFGCNRYLLQNWGLEQNVERFAQAGARVAREAQEAMGVEAFIGGAIGPVNRQSLGVSNVEIRTAFEEVVEGLLLGGVDLFVLETFGSLDELLIAVEVCHGDQRQASRSQFNVYRGWANPGGRGARCCFCGPPAGRGVRGGSELQLRPAADF